MNLLALFFSFFLLASCADVEDPPITHEVTFEIKHGDKDLGTITLGLFGTVVPKSVKNFVGIANGFKDVSYNNTIFHRVIKNFMIQGGDFEFSDGRGGYSIYGKKFDDENFALGFDKPGYIAYANSGKDTNGSQFFITTAITNWLSGVHVIFGKVIAGYEVVTAIENVKTGKHDRPVEEVKITGVSVKELNVSEAERLNWIENRIPKTNSTGWIIFVLLIFVSVTAYGIRLRHLHNKDLQDQISFHRV